MDANSRKGGIRTHGREYPLLGRFDQYGTTSQQIFEHKADLFRRL
jgi:hypothetical protein